MFGRIVRAALIAGAAAGLVAWGVHALKAVPLIVEAETYEHANHAHGAPAPAVEARDAAGSGAGAQGFESPLDGRAMVTLIADLGLGVGFALALLGAIALSGADIVDAKIFTPTDGMAIDTFWVQDPNGDAFDSQDRLTRMSHRIEQTLAGSLRPTQELAKKIETQAKSRTRVFAVPPRAFLDNDASRTHTVIEVSGRDRPGLLHELTRTLTGLNLQIASAHVSTYGETAVDVFYVKDVFGLKVSHDDKIAQIREALMAVLTDPADRASAATEASAAE